MKYNAIVRSIGSSLYITIPAKEARSENIEEGDSVEAEINKLKGGKEE